MVLDGSMIEMPAANDLISQGPSPLRFESARLIYRGVEKEDLDYFYKLGQDTEAIYALSMHLPQPNSKSAAERVYEYVKDQTLIFVMACLHPEDVGKDRSATSITSRPAHTPTPKKPHELTAIGHVLLMKPREGFAHHRNYTLGVAILKEYRSTGYGSEAIRWMLEWAFRMSNIHRVSLECFGWNTGAAELYKKIGFKLEGTKREAIWFNGRWQDVLDFGILEDEWRETQQKNL